MSSTSDFDLPNSKSLQRPRGYVPTSREVFTVPADAVAKRKRESTGGPVTDEGKATAARNAISHGVSAACVLMPGETLDERRESARRWSETFKPTTAGEAEIVAKIVDVLARQERLDGFERSVRERGIEDELKKTAAAKKVENIETAQAAIQGLLGAVDDVGPALIDFEDVQKMVPALQRTLEFVESADVPMSLLLPLRTALNELSVESILGGVGQEQFLPLSTAARDVGTWLMLAKKCGEAELEEERRRLEDDPTIGSEAKVRSVDRYRARLSREVDDLLRVLKQVRELARGDGAGPSSFFRIEVRVVNPHLAQR